MTPIPDPMHPEHITVPLTAHQRQAIAELQQTHELVQARLTYYLSAITHGAGYGTAKMVEIGAEGLVLELPPAFPMSHSDG